MSKPSNQSSLKEEGIESAKTGDFETKILTKSDWPKTPKQTIKMVLNLFVNFFPF